MAYFPKGGSYVKRSSVLIGLFLLSSALAVGSGYGQDKDKQDTAPAAKGTLPANFGKIGLSADQKKKVLAVRATYKTKIDDLKSQIEQLTKEDYAECLKVLTDDQRDQLKKIATQKIDAGNKGGDDKK
jgi:hypothetical protein